MCFSHAPRMRNTERRTVHFGCAGYGNNWNGLNAIDGIRMCGRLMVNLMGASANRNFLLRYEELTAMFDVHVYTMFYLSSSLSFSTVSVCIFLSISDISSISLYTASANCLRWFWNMLYSLLADQSFKSSTWTRLMLLAIGFASVMCEHEIKLKYIRTGRKNATEEVRSELTKMSSKH